MLDAVSCIQLAYGDLDDDLRAEARHHIASLLHTDVADVETAIAALRTVAQQLPEVETRLHAAGRPFAMRKVQIVRQRVEHTAVI